MGGDLKCTCRCDGPRRIRERGSVATSGARQRPKGVRAVLVRVGTEEFPRRLAVGHALRHRDPLHEGRFHEAETICARKTRQLRPVFRACFFIAGEFL